jgi:uncharacterized protein YkwD
MKPAFKSLMKDYPELVIKVIDFDSNKDPFYDAEVRYLPTIMIFKEGAVVEEYKGGKDKASFKALFDRLKAENPQSSGGSAADSTTGGDTAADTTTGGDAATGGSTGGDSTDQLAKSLTESKLAFDLCNAERKKEGKAAFTWSDDLHKISYDWSKEQAALGKISHDNFDANYALWKNSGSYNSKFAENVAMNMASSWSGSMGQVVEQWMGSTGHRANILGDYTFMAVGTYYSEAKGEYYFTQLFG